MDMRELNNSQLVLLTILVSFVTSIATGIITVSLLDQAPESVTKTIDRVVEKTVEKIVPQSIKETIREERVVIKEEDYVSKIVEAAWPSIISLANKRFVTSDEGVVTEQKDNSPAFVVGANGEALMLLGDTYGHATSTYALTVGSSTIRYYKKTPIAKARVVVLTPDTGDLVLAKLSFGRILFSEKPPRIGQQIIVTDGSAVSLGIVSRVKKNDGGDTEITAIDAGAQTAKRSLLLGLDGLLYGILGTAGEVIPVTELSATLTPPAPTPVAPKESSPTKP
jgi:hypothetical protein